jgi:hypothetical protein
MIRLALAIAMLMPLAGCGGGDGEGDGVGGLTAAQAEALNRAAARADVQGEAADSNAAARPDAGKP